MKRNKLFFSLIILSFCSFQIFAQQNYRCNNGSIHFHSNAALELIEATSENLIASIDPAGKTFSFVVAIISFRGFNGTLQREHFNENYMETDKFKTAVFNGKIIEDIDFTIDSVYHVRAKGILKIHGTDQERIIKSTLTVSGSKLKIDAQFSVLLKDHKIKVPKVVHEKIASEIIVTIKAELKTDSNLAPLER
ncbi:MAG: YceI family protein [Bacteroidia bacterium]